MVASADVLLLMHIDSNSHVGNVNKIPHVNDFTYLQFF